MKDNKLLLKDFAIKSIMANRGSRRKQTTNGYLEAFRFYIEPYLGDKSIAEINPMKIKEWQSKLSERLAPWTVRGVSANLALRSAFGERRLKLDRDRR
ncbi:MAG: hypothetical protein LBU73_01715 [Helicobacteraceae bacterium]|jgi:hypothetical protein|nr:hypothetical protein [Helicobacteraceae bacterium]